MFDQLFKGVPLETVSLLDALAVDPATFLGCIPKDIVNFIKPYLYSLKMTTQSTILTVNINLPFAFRIYESLLFQQIYKPSLSNDAELYFVHNELNTIVLKTRNHSIKIYNFNSNQILVTGKAANTENYYSELINRIFGTKFPGITVISEKTKMQNCTVDIYQKVDIEKVHNNVNSVISKDILCPPKVQKRGAKIVENPRISGGAVWIKTIHGKLIVFKSGKILISGGGGGMDDLKSLVTILESII